MSSLAISSRCVEISLVASSRNLVTALLSAVRMRDVYIRNAFKRGMEIGMNMRNERCPDGVEWARESRVWIVRPKQWRH